MKWPPMYKMPSPRAAEEGSKAYALPEYLWKNSFWGEIERIPLSMIDFAGGAHLSFSEDGYSV